jgi:hypothetical protein
MASTVCRRLSAIAFATSALRYIIGRADYTSYLGMFYLNGAGELAVFCLAMSGALIGFLWFNAHPAEVFMGDTGALALGGGLARSPFCLNRSSCSRSWCRVRRGNDLGDSAAVRVQVPASRQPEYALSTAFSVERPPSPF